MIVGYSVASGDRDVPSPRFHLCNLTNLFIESVIGHEVNVTYSVASGNWNVPSPGFQLNNL